MAKAKRESPKHTNGSKIRPNDTPRPSGYFLSLSLKNVRCFGPEQTLDLSDGNGKPARWTVILGLNGTGKTTLLQSIVGFEVLPELLSGSGARRFFNSVVVYHQNFSRNQESEAVWNAKIAVSRMLLDSPSSVVGFQFQRAVTTTGRLDRFEPHEKTPEGVDPSPWCCGYGASRRIGPAVVAVDEIDLHLHPVWQRKLMSFLTERFRNTQFIVTAHSPLMAQAAVDANLAVLRREGDHVIIDNDVDNIRGWRIDQILTSDLFGLKTARPPQIENLLEQRQELLTQPKLSATDKRRLKKLEAEIGELPTGETADDVKEREEIRKTLNLLLDAGRPSA